MRQSLFVADDTKAGVVNQRDKAVFGYAVRIEKNAGFGFGEGDGSRLHAR